MTEPERKVISVLDKALMAIAITLALAILAGGVAWGRNDTKIVSNTKQIKKVETGLTKRIDRMDKRWGRKFDKMERLMLRIYGKVK